MGNITSTMAELATLAETDSRTAKDLARIEDLAAKALERHATVGRAQAAAEARIAATPAADVDKMRAIARQAVAIYDAVWDLVAEFHLHTTHLEDTAMDFDDDVDWCEAVDRWGHLTGWALTTDALVGMATLARDATSSEADGPAATPQPSVMAERLATLTTASGGRR